MSLITTPEIVIKLRRENELRRRLQFKSRTLEELEELQKLQEELQPIDYQHACLDYISELESRLSILLAPKSTDDNRMVMSAKACFDSGNCLEISEYTENNYNADLAIYTLGYKAGYNAAKTETQFFENINDIEEIVKEGESHGKG